jgi:membrane protease subunit (stomatin/prohibitin family)
MAAAQGQAQAEQIHQKARERDQTKDLDLDRPMVALCPECGAPLAPRDECEGCGAKVGGKAKFCPECGQKR